MDPSAIAAISSAVVRMLVPYFKDVASGGAEELGKNAANSAAGTAAGLARRLVQAVKSRFGSDESSRRSLVALMDDPDNADAVGRVRQSLQQVMASDQPFAAEMVSLLQQISGTGAELNFVNNIRGDVAKLVQIGEVHGDVNL
jgi:hypothetical protein